MIKSTLNSNPESTARIATRRATGYMQERLCDRPESSMTSNSNNRPLLIASLFATLLLGRRCLAVMVTLSIVLMGVFMQTALTRAQVVPCGFNCYIIGDELWEDSTPDGHYDRSAEVPIAGVRVDLYKTVYGSLIPQQTTFSNSKGEYRFDVALVDYLFEFSLPPCTSTF